MKKTTTIHTILFAFLSLFLCQCSDNEVLTDADEATVKEKEVQASTTNQRSSTIDYFGIVPLNEMELAPQNGVVWVRFIATNRDKNRLKRRMQNRLGITPIIFEEESGFLNTYILECKSIDYNSIYSILSDLYYRGRIFSVEHPFVFKVKYTAFSNQFSNEDWDAHHIEIEDRIGGEIAYTYNVQRGASSNFTSSPFEATETASETHELIVARKACCPHITIASEETDDGDRDDYVFYQ